MNDAAKRRLLDRLRPELARTGRVRRLLSTTHNLEADFFDGDFLCTALSIPEADVSGHAGGLALQRKLAGLDHSGVLCEARAYVDRPSLRTVVHPVTLRGACLHAKLVVIEYEHAVCVLVGSANLTSAGYRHNREVAGDLLAHEHESDACARVAAVLHSAHEVLAVFAERAHEFLAELGMVMERLERWSQGAAPSETAPIVWSDGERPLWQALLERWAGRAAVSRIRIVSPFWSEDGSRSTPLRRLLAELRTRRVLAPRCDLELYLESSPLPAGGFAAKGLPPVYFSDFEGVAVRAIPVDPTVAQTDLDTKLDTTTARTLHAKVLILEGRDQALAYAGSANFTRNGYGWRHHGQAGERVIANIEAGWVFELSPKDAHRLLPPRANDGVQLTSLRQACAAATLDDEEKETLRFWPEALLAAELTTSGRLDELELTTCWAATTPQGWTVHAPDAHSADGPPLGPALVVTEGAAATIKTALSATALEAILRARHVIVSAPEGSTPFPIGVAAGEARHHLPLSPAGAKPGEQELLRYYQGRITLEDLYPELEGLISREPIRSGAARDVSVDTSRIQAYQIRAFVDALPGIRRELAAARGSRGALFQAFRGEVSPVALACHVVDEVASGRRTALAGAFQLVELSVMLRSLAAQAPPEVEHYAQTCEDACRELESRLAILRDRHTLELGPGTAFSTYAARLSAVAP